MSASPGICQGFVHRLLPSTDWMTLIILNVVLPVELSLKLQGLLLTQEDVKPVTNLFWCLLGSLRQGWGLFQSYVHHIYSFCGLNTSNLIHFQSIIRKHEK